MYFNVKWPDFIVYLLTKMLQLTGMPNTESYIPVVFYDIVITTKCAGMHFYIIGNIILSYKLIIICLFLLIFSFLFASFLSLYSLSISFPLISFWLFVLFLYSICSFNFVRIGLCFNVLLVYVRLRSKLRSQTTTSTKNFFLHTSYYRA